jgi:hypothetical protein
MTSQEKSEFVKIVEASIVKDAVGEDLSDAISEVVIGLWLMGVGGLLLLTCVGGLFSVFLDALNLIFN